MPLCGLPTSPPPLVHPPVCSGTCPISAQDGILTYGMKEDGSARWVDLVKATPEQLNTLSEACQKATFGRNQEDILDETYRKAGQMSATDFTTRFNLEKSGILDGVYTHLLEGFGEAGKRIEAELYKLNVYGKGSFFKAHKDTPRGEKMFGSLVIVFPAAHVGGALLLRHDGKEEEFNSAHILSSFDAPTVAYIAFYGDIEHEVALVESGHRVTLTYNLYFAKATPALKWSPSARSSSDLKSSLSSLLNDETFLPEGGILGFGLRTSLHRMKSVLKGTDSLLARASEQLGLETSLKAVYSKDSGVIMLDSILMGSLGDEQVEESIIERLNRDYHGDILEQDPYDTYDTSTVTEVTWITQMSSLIDLEATYISYGNEPSIGYIYGDLALMVYIPDLNDRGLAQDSEKSEEAEL
ncbi:hypothetical protein DFH08DRAFT_908771 [Mycena albidolilacea]|uniref:Prolyl 4-hydroxylase alpha subunit Fe(2+) 2OG dioxygenase domain-containing protein n=1 Tax=Mycena albidolilacea TaxID=1033008 RepID=A0AAD7F3H4_9AGAR|nr:hypothetical protein DFH08DRAFT_908771 [Mycena albidolilacea]